MTYYLLTSNTITSTGSASVTLSSIPSTFDHLVLLIRQKGDSGGGQTVYRGQLRLNGDTGTNYHQRVMHAIGNSVSQFNSNSTYVNMGDVFTGNQTDAVNPSALEVFFPNYCNNAGTVYRSYSWFGGYPGPTASTVGTSFIATGTWTNNSAINSIQIWQEGTNTFLPGTSFYLYGIK